MKGIRDPNLQELSESYFKPYCSLVKNEFIQHNTPFYLHLSRKILVNYILCQCFQFRYFGFSVFFFRGKSSQKNDMFVLQFLVSLRIQMPPDTSRIDGQNLQSPRS